MSPLWLLALIITVAACSTSPREHGGLPPPADAGGGGGQCDVSYPAGPYGWAEHDVLADETFETDGAVLALSDLYDPCATGPRLLAIRVGAAWCGTCRWSVAHTGAYAGGPLADQLTWLDVLVGDEWNGVPGPEDLAAWRDRISGAGRLALDPELKTKALLQQPAPLPWIALVDRRTMRMEAVFSAPDPWAFAARASAVEGALEGVDGGTVADPPPALVDGFFRPDQWDLIQDMRWASEPPSDPTNAFGDDSAAAALGTTLFGDPGFSSSGTVACATCHVPERSFTDGLPQAVGLAPGDRNAPSILLSSFARWQFWDGRADTLWAQALGPMEGPAEMGATRLGVAHRVYRVYRDRYEAVFGSMPALDEPARFPPQGMPGDPAWATLEAEDQAAVTRVFVNVGKAIAAYERTLRVAPNALDAYIDGDRNALNEAQKVGLRAFLDAGCAQCHYGPRLADDAFHATRFPTGRRDGTADRGRIDGAATLATSEFRGDGPFSDAPSSAPWLRHVAPFPRWLGAFKTPALRGMPSTAPYGHGGTLRSVGDVLLLYGSGGLPDSSGLAAGTAEPWLPRLHDSNVAALDSIRAFLPVLSATPP